MRRSAAATISDYLQRAEKRMDLKDVTESDLEKTLEHIEHVEKLIRHELGDK